MRRVLFNSRDELISIDLEKVALVKANGNYSTLYYISQREVMLSFGITKVFELIQNAHLTESQFVKIGRSLIINQTFLERIDVLRQQLILTDGSVLFDGKEKRTNEIRVTVPKNLLRAYKAMLTQPREKSK
jgi:DNA-binding LytR/AlgR family response regulator